jgi:hypothetical protein
MFKAPPPLPDILKQNSGDDTLPPPKADTSQQLPWRRGMSFEIRDIRLRDDGGERGARHGLRNHANLMFIHAFVRAYTSVRWSKDLCVHG